MLLGFPGTQQFTGFVHRQSENISSVSECPILIYLPWTEREVTIQYEKMELVAVSENDSQAVGQFLCLLEECFRGSFPYELRKKQWKERYISRPRRMLTKMPCRIYLCKSGPQLLGFVVFHYEDTSVGRIGEIDEIYMDLIHRKGYGTELVHFSVRELQKFSISRIKVNMQVDFVGRMAFWEGLGFRTRRHVMEVAVKDAIPSE